MTPCKSCEMRVLIRPRFLFCSVNFSCLSITADIQEMNCDNSGLWQKMLHGGNQSPLYTLSTTSFVQHVQHVWCMLAWGREKLIVVKAQLIFLCLPYPEIMSVSSMSRKLPTSWLEGWHSYWKSQKFFIFSCKIDFEAWKYNSVSINTDICIYWT